VMVRPISEPHSFLMYASYVIGFLPSLLGVVQEAGSVIWNPLHH